MTQDQYIIKRKLTLLELGQTLGNISETCRRLGVSRQHFYDVKNAIQEEGLDGLLEKARNRPRLGNRVAPHIEQKVLDYCLEFPTQGKIRVSNELKRRGFPISDGGVRLVWLRHGLEKKRDRLLRLETWVKEHQSEILTASQVAALEMAQGEKEISTESIETHHPGFLFSQDTYYVGYIKGVGKIYQQTGIDTFSNVGFAKLYTFKTALTAADFLNERVLPFFDQHQIRILRTLTDRGTEYCGIPEQHPYELFLQMNEMEHSKTKAYHPQTNGCVERLNQIIQDEFYSVAFRKKFYFTLEEIQADLDEFMRYYNEERTNQGKRCQGRTPKETFLASLDLYQKYVFEKVASSEVTAR